MRLVILTGLRCRLVRFARLEEFEEDVWIIPGKKMKGKLGKTPDFRVPLSTEAKQVVAQAKTISRDEFLFPGIRKGVISDSTLSKYMKEHKLEGVLHGFRSTLRTWLTDQTDISYEIAEMIIAHQAGSQVERA